MTTEMKTWSTIEEKIAGNIRECHPPVIISASRATDIPAFYADWLIESVKKGGCLWKNPFSGIVYNVSFAKTRLFVFWSKNPQPLLEKLSFFDDNGYNYYFQYTINDYENESWESGLPPLEKRIETFVSISEKIGKGRVVWRFDPIIISDNLCSDELLRRIEKIGEKIHQYTDRMVFSFIDVDTYKKVKFNLKKLNLNIKDIDRDAMVYLAKNLSLLNTKWGLKLATCSEDIDLSDYGIEHSRCIDDSLIISQFKQDEELMDYIGFREIEQDIFSQPSLQKQLTGEQYNKMKDRNQRKACGCIKSKDIGQYNTCRYNCIYCYANSKAHNTVKVRTLKD